ncbi:low-affinity Zn(2+) transporter zrt2 [Fusarium irregulare]|uniref:Low-affinity Zn(2+) transporter zrt2 n=1 Tax=Fusarium irregulare TaxID=2494466 RepID=A0A9W8U4F6_9HYPO|nr:low-affinity Zn(2+) transporter zrt2 [Fusarium irregulare]KAJ4028821.1 low-affinity Zn(2+) transporter zrt2 [Fusarium irregulare]
MADAAECNGEAVDLGRRGLRVGAIFIIMASSMIGAILPIFLARQKTIPVPKLTFFICKFVGTGVIIATAFMHLLVPAVENLGDECLEDRLGGYDWAEAIALMTVIVMFFVEMLAARLSNADMEHNHSDELDPAMEIIAKKQPSTDIEAGDRRGSGYAPGGDEHLAHGREHKEGDAQGGLAGQLLAIFILEFGVVFHSIFIGLTLGTIASDELTVLLIVLVFHQMFEGLGLGSRLAVAPWPSNRQWMPYLLGFIFALSTPVGIAAGIGAKPNNASDQKLINGIFDAISAGILMYTGLVELLAHEFMFNPYMRKAPIRILLLAFACVAFGVAVMAVLAKWA